MVECRGFDVLSRGGVTCETLSRRPFAGSRSKAGKWRGFWRGISRSRTILLKLKQVSETNLIASRVMHKTLVATQTCNWAEVQSDGGQVVMGGWFGWLHAPIEVML
jgi:hypothetical protein